MNDSNTPEENGGDVNKAEIIANVRDLAIGMVLGAIIIAILASLGTMAGMKTGLQWFGFDYYKLP